MQNFMFLVNVSDQALPILDIKYIDLHVVEIRIKNNFSTEC